MTFQVNISHSFGDFELDIAFQAGPGVTALFGPSGSGKSSIIKSVAGLLKPSRAHIRNGEQVMQDARRFVRPHLRNLGVVFQDARLFPHLSVAQNLDYGSRFAKNRKAANRTDVIDLLDLLHLLGRKPASLSGGEQQRVAIGRALLSMPSLLLMDEPLANLDAPRKAEILPYLERLKSDTGIPILYVSHSMDEVARLADDIVLLKDGRMVAHGPLFDVLSDPDMITHVGVREAGAVISARVLSHDQDGLSTLQVRAGTLELPGVAAPEQSDIRLRVLASDVILSLAPPEGLSAMNALPVTVQAIHDGHGPGAAIVLDAAGDTLLARVTSRTVERMGLTPGLHCYAIVKAMAVAPLAIGRGV